jgi:hypothetical protein
MSTTALCVYCEQLPEDHRGHADRVVRCPLCKTDVGVTDGGVKFRLTADDAMAPEPRAITAAGGRRGMMAVWRRWFAGPPGSSR